MNIECIQVNLNKSSLATGLMTNELESSPMIGFITEPYTAFKKVVGKPYEYNVYPEIACDSAPRAALYIPRTVKNVGLPHLSSSDCQVALLYLQIGIILLASVYLDINDTPTPDWLDTIVELAEAKNYGIIIALDSNAHSYLYGPDENPRGRLFEQFILQNRFQVANRGNTPTFQTLQAESFIDVTLLRDIGVFNWRVDTAYNASDHNSIRFTIDQVLLVPPREIRPWAKADWIMFKNELASPGYTIPEVITCKKLDKMVSYLYSRLEEGLDKACPKILAKSKFKGTKWFNERIKKLKIKVQRQYNVARRHDTQEEWKKYLSIHKKFKYKCRKAKTAMWRHFVSDTEDEHRMARLARIAQHNSKAQLHTLQRADGSFTSPGKETLIEMAQAHFPSANSTIPQETYTSSRCLLSREIQDTFKPFLTVDKVRKSLEQFSPMKAPGPDGMKAIVYKHVPDVVLHFIYVIYMACLKLHYTPILWRKSKVVFLPKPNKPNYIRGKFFRPIVLSNVALKGLERIITWRMEDMLKYYPIHAKQHGFTKGRSTESAISNTVDYIEKYLFRQKSCIGVFLDISSAYDSISIDHIRTSLYKHGGDTDLVEWYYHYLSNRHLALNLHEQTIHLHTAVGFPQGGVASAKFWLIAFDPAIRIINSSFVEGNGYADDCCVIFGGRKPETMVRRLQRILDELVEWGNTCGLRFNPDKTIVVHFSRKLPQLVPHLRVDQDYVPFSKEALYLGIILDHKLTWNRHINSKIAKGKKFLMKMSGISRAIWGPKPKLSRWVFRCVVRPMIVYGSVTWAHAIDRPALESKLRKINRLAIATYTLFPRSSPTRAVEILTDTFPLHIWLEKEALCAFIRLAKLLPLTWTGRNNNRRRNVAHRRFWVDKIEEYGITSLLLENDSCSILAPKLSFTIHSDSFRADPSYFRSLERSEWEVYTDGSKKDGKVGSAFIIYRFGLDWKQGKFRLNNTATVFQAELFALIQAAFALRESEVGHGKCHFFSDSLSSLQALLTNEIKHRLVYKLIAQLNILSHIGWDLNLFWVKAHSQIQGNEKADILAKEATELPTVTYTPMPKQQIRVKVLEVLRLKWESQWNEYNEARHSKLFLDKPCKSRGKTVMNLNRIDLRRLIMAITNHNSLNYHQNLQDETINPTCRFCRLFDETFDHFLVCTGLHEERSDDIIWPFTEERPWEVDSFVRFINSVRIRQALDSRVLIGINETTDRRSEARMESEVEDDDDDPMNRELSMEIEEALDTT